MAARKRPLFCGAIAAAMAFILVVEGSIPDETNKAKGYWATFGTDKATGQPILTSSWIDRLAPQAWAVVAVGHLCRLRRHPRLPVVVDRGEELRLVLLSVTEGEDKPLKYPTIFNTADVAIITKIDMTEAADCDLATLRENIQRVRPGMPIFEISSKSGEGMREWLLFVTARARESSEDALS